MLRLRCRPTGNGPPYGEEGAGSDSGGQRTCAQAGVGVLPHRRVVAGGAGLPERFFPQGAVLLGGGWATCTMRSQRLCLSDGGPAAWPLLNRDRMPANEHEVVM